MFGFIKDFFSEKIPMFKNAKDARHLLYVHPLLAMVLFDMAHYCNSRNLPFKITSMIRTPMENIKVGGKSLTHPTGRAADISTRGFDVYQVAEFKKHFDEKYEDIAAISTIGRKQLVVYHTSGSGYHLHVQIHAHYAIENAWVNL